MHWEYIKLQTRIVRWLSIQDEMPRWMHPAIQRRINALQRQARKLEQRMVEAG